MSDPYQDPKKVFDELRQRKNIQSYKISEKTDFKQAKEIGKMDIEILNFEMKLKDRPHSKEYFLLAAPRLCVDRQKGTIKGRFTKKPEIEV